MASSTAFYVLCCIDCQSAHGVHGTITLPVQDPTGKIGPGVRDVIVSKRPNPRSPTSGIRCYMLVSTFELLALMGACNVIQPCGAIYTLHMPQLETAPDLSGMHSAALTAINN